MMIITPVEAKEWAENASYAHLAVFNETLPPEFERVDYALLISEEETGKVTGYLTVRELDKDTLYLKSGGVFDQYRGTDISRATYRAVIAYCAARYENLTCLVETGNIGKLISAFKIGFRVIGLRNYKGDMLVELLLTREAK